MRTWLLRTFICVGIENQIWRACLTKTHGHVHTTHKAIEYADDEDNDTWPNGIEFFSEDFKFEKSQSLPAEEGRLLKQIDDRVLKSDSARLILYDLCRFTFSLLPQERIKSAYELCKQ